MGTFEQLRSIIGATLKVSPSRITETTKKEDIATWDSLGHVNLMMALEQTFDVFLDVEDFPRMISVPAILQYLRDQGIE